MRLALHKLIAKIGEDNDCLILPPTSIPNVGHHTLPDDLRLFYTLTGGVSLYPKSGYSSRILPPHEVVPTNPLLAGDLDEPDISDDWYVIATDDNGDYLAVDLNLSRLGRCYDCFHETYGLLGQVPIIAHSFTELLERLFENHGDYPYWLRDDFVSLGDAYELVEGEDDVA